jgi:hypothetical protein
MYKRESNLRGPAPLHHGDGGRSAHRLRRRGWLLLVLLAAPNAWSLDFRAGEVEGLADLTVSYGLMIRTEDRDDDFIAVANGGDANSANFDDGNLNYDTGVVSNMFASTGELALKWRNVGMFARGVAFYDYEQENGDRQHREFDSKTLDAVGSDAEFRDHFVFGQFDVAGTPVQLRVGDQVINWGEVTFVRDGVDTINPFDLVALFQPARDARDTRTPQGMAWAVANVTETFAVEAYYQYDWEGLRLPAVGSFISTNDLIGTGGLNFATIGQGRYSDLGTDLDQAFALPEGTLGFDENFFKYPERIRDYPKDGGQYGAALVAITQGNNALKVGLHYIRYHSRLPLIGTLTAGQDAIDATAQDNVDRVADQLTPIYEDTGLPTDQARGMAEDTAAELVTNEYINEAGYFTEYPENIDMIGLTFNTATMRTGTLVAAEISHHFDYPFQQSLVELYNASLSPVQFDDSYKDNTVGTFGADERISGYALLDRTQFSFSAAQLLGRRLGATQTTVGVDGAFIYVHDFPGDGETPLQATEGGNKDSWGYRLFGQLEYTSVFGGLNLLPRITFIHDVDGYTPSPLSSFREDRKAISVGLQANYINRWLADISYTNFFDGEPGNPLTDRDFIRLQISYGF